MVIRRSSISLNILLMQGPRALFERGRVLHREFEQNEVAGKEADLQHAFALTQGATRASAGAPPTLRTRVWRIFTASSTKMLCFCGAMA